MSAFMNVIYTIISEILLFWHSVWAKVVGSGHLLATNWSWILSIIFLVLTVRAILFPIFVKQIKSQRAMQALQPKVKALQEKHKGDRETMQKELMNLYREEKANPLMGCLPMFLQIPVFLSLFHVLRHLKPSMPERMRTLYGWSLGQFDEASHARLFGAPIAASFKSTAKDLLQLDASSANVKIVAGILVAMMIVTTFLTSRQMILKTGWSEDPQQKMIQRLMLYGVPFSLLISGGLFPIGVVIYWVVQNMFSLGQQVWVLRKYPPPPSAKSTTKTTDKGNGKTSRTLLGKPAKQAGPGRAIGLDKPAASKADKNGAATPAVDGASLAPKVGVRPANPKKRGAAKKR